MLPTVVLHNAVSADGRTAGLDLNLDLFRRLAGNWKEAVTLTGSDTILAALRRDVSGAKAFPLPNEARQRNRLAVIDSRGRVKDWRRVKSWPCWDSFVSIGARSTPRPHLDYLRYQEVDDLTVGESQVDLAEALESLSSRYGAGTVLVQSGGTLNAALLRQRLVNEVSLLIHPVMLGGMSPHTVYRTLDLETDSPVEMKLVDCQMIDQAYAWLRYEVIG